MIVPIITSISREVFRAVPDSQREAAFALGATRWEATWLAVLRGSKRGIFGSAMLGLGRALGETMAVTMVIGNSHIISPSLLAPGCTLASGIANEFTEAVDDMYLSALFELGLVLLLLSILTNILAHMLVGAVSAAKHAASA
jgi:phosphate transport system permease protein